MPCGAIYVLQSYFIILSNGELILGYIEVRRFDHEGLRQLPHSFVWLCNCSVCISCVAKQFCD